MSKVLTYAIGDIHGRIDLLDKLLKKIEADARGEDYRLVFLGDYVDRGHASRQVIDRLIQLKKMDWANPPVFLLGNHEDQMSQVLLKKYDWEFFNRWLYYGGTNTIESYGVSPKYGEEHGRSLRLAFQEAVSFEHKAFLKSLKTHFHAGSFFFCHAGVDFDRPLDKQRKNDLLWIRQPFNSSTKTAAKIIIHGHTITDDFMPAVRRNRIGIDTGAYKSENLTACAVKGSEVFGFVQTLDN